jgi:hypothetical protein
MTPLGDIRQIETGDILGTKLVAGFDQLKKPCPAYRICDRSGRLFYPFRQLEAYQPGVVKL